MSDDSRQSFFNKIRVQKDLEQITGSVIERHGRGAQLVSKFAALAREDQDFVYHWAGIVGQSNEELRSLRQPRAAGIRRYGPGRRRGLAHGGDG